MISTLILVSLVFGKWWKLAIPLGGLAWAILLVVDDVGSGIGFLVGAGVLGAVNVAVGAAIFQVLVAGVRALRRRRQPAG